MHMEQIRPRRRIERIVSTSGYTLVEVIVALLISCVMVTAMFSVALTAKGGSGKSARTIIANQGLAQVTSMLRGFATGCGCDVNSGNCPAPDCTLLSGPNVGAANTWSMDGFSGVVAEAPAMSNKYAYTLGVHTLTGVLPAWFEGPPYGAVFTYTVTAPYTTPEGRPIPKVTAKVDWTEP